MICSKCGHDNAEKPHSLDPWCMYQVKDGVVINAMFLPDRIPEGWYDSPKAAKQALIDPTEMFREKATEINRETAMRIIEAPKSAHDPKVTIYSAEVELVEPKEINIKVDGRTKAGKAAKAKLNDDSSRTD